MDLWNEIEKLVKQLQKGIDNLANNGKDLAEKERAYKIAVNKTALELKANDMPVTLINQVIYGYEDIANLRFERDTAEVKYNANQEYINVMKLVIKIYENQLNREYGGTKL